MRILISGPPASGKSSLARHLASTLGATIIDFDDIAKELGSTSNHDHPDEIRRAVRAEVERRINALDGPAVVIRAAPDPNEREALAQRIEADRVIVLDTPAAVAKQRAAADERPDWTATAIDRWWSKYQPSKIDSPATGVDKKEGAMPEPIKPAEGEPKPEPKQEPELGDAGKKALDDERKARRDAEKTLREVQAQLKELTDKDKPEIERLTERSTTAEKAVADAEARAMRLEVALAKGLTATQAKRLVGSTVDELTADADDLLGSFTPAGSTTALPSRKPNERLTPGGETSEEPEPDIDKVVAKVPRL